MSCVFQIFLIIFAKVLLSTFVYLQKMVQPTYPSDIPALLDATATAPAITAGQLITHEESIAAEKDEKHFIATPSYARAKARRLTIDNASIQATDETGAAVPPDWFNQAFNQAMVPFVQQILASNKVRGLSKSFSLCTRQTQSPLR